MPKRRLILLLCVTLLALPQSNVPQEAIRFPFAEALSYRVGWRMVTAGSAQLKLVRGAKDGWQLSLDLATAGFVNQLYHVADSYKLSATEKLCGNSVRFDAQEGKHHMVTALDFDNEKHKLLVDIKNVAAKTTRKAEFDIPPCTYDIVGALMVLRASKIEPGAKITLPVTDGKKLANVVIEGLGKDKLAIQGKSYNTVRYEALLFNNVLYRRKGKLLIWVTDDAQRIPVQMRFVFGFPIGDITLELEKQQAL